MFEIETFINSEKSMIIAPAGYGKTYTIISALKTHQDSKKVLVLTHTHAGVASIREKAKKESIDPTTYTLDTICSFALFITESFIDKSRMPSPEDDNYFSFAVQTAASLLNAKPIKDVLTCTYSHLIVDEYQDCTISQHQFIVTLSSMMKTHILGDPLQGIFDFNDQIVNMESPQQMMGFFENIQTLNEPWRWKNSNVQLGQDLANIRRELTSTNTPINISNYRGIQFFQCGDVNDIYNASPTYYFFSQYIRNNAPESLLVIVPQKHNVQPFAQRFKMIFGIRELEAFDDKWYYELSKQIDSIDSDNNILPLTHNVLLELFPKVVVNEWINDKHEVKKKRGNIDNDGEFYNELCGLYLTEQKDKLLWTHMLIELFKQKYLRQCKLEKTNAILNAIRHAYSESISVYDGMKKDRDKARRVGRRVIGRYVGTTLLTKGLEFDTVFVINPNDFSNKKHLYVALTRATKNLIVISNTNRVQIR